MLHKILWIGNALTLTELGVLPQKKIPKLLISEISKIHVIHHNMYCTVYKRGLWVNGRIFFVNNTILVRLF